MIDKENKVNIFAIEGDVDTGKIDWIASGKTQDNYRTVKMILESCQILCTVLNEQGLDAPYRSFNPKHPSCLWAAESSDNFENLIKHCASIFLVNVSTIFSVTLEPSSMCFDTVPSSSTSSVPL